MRRRVFAVLAVALIAALAYLREPAWLASHTYGFAQDTRGGETLTWTRGRAAFFVPATARAVRLRLRDVKDLPSDWPITATITIDDRIADQVTLGDEAWREMVLRLPPPGSRRLRRIDIKLDRLRQGQRGLLFGGFEALQ